MVYTEYTIPRPRQYPDALENNQGPKKGPLTVLTASQQGVDATDPESVALRAGEVVAKYGTDEQAVDAYELARLQADPGYQKRRRLRLMRDWVTARKPVCRMVEVRDNAGRIRGYHVIMSLFNPKTGLSEIKTRWISIEQIEKVAT